MSFAAPRKNVVIVIPQKFWFGTFFSPRRDIVVESSSLLFTRYAVNRLNQVVAKPCICVYNVYYTYIYIYRSTVIVVKQNDYSRGVVNARRWRQIVMFSAMHLRSNYANFPAQVFPLSQTHFLSSPPALYPHFPRVFTAIPRRWHTTFDWQFRGVLWRDKLVTTCLIFVHPLSRAEPVTVLFPFNGNFIFTASHLDPFF